MKIRARLAVATFLCGLGCSSLIAETDFIRRDDNIFKGEKTVLSKDLSLECGVVHYFAAWIAVADNALENYRQTLVWRGQSLMSDFLLGDGVSGLETILLAREYHSSRWNFSLWRPEVNGIYPSEIESSALPASYKIVVISMVHQSGQPTSVPEQICYWNDQKILFTNNRAFKPNLYRHPRALARFGDGNLPHHDIVLIGTDGGKLVSGLFKPQGKDGDGDGGEGSKHAIMVVNEPRDPSYERHITGAWIFFGGLFLLLIYVIWDWLDKR